MSWRRVRGKGPAITKVKVNLKGTTRMRHSRTAMSLRGRTTAGLGLLRRFLGSARVRAAAETPVAVRVRALLARTQRCAAFGAHAHAKLALETALATVSTLLLALHVRAHCHKAVPLAPHLGSGAAPVKAGVGRIFRRLQALRQWHFRQLDVRELLAALLMKPARVQHAPPERNKKKRALS